MAHLPEDNDINSWHRYFAIENNNRAWDLAAAPTRSAEENLELLNAAHAAAHHWGVIGTPLNVMRAKTLLAEAHALCGSATMAMALSTEIADYFLSRDTEDWELAFVYTIRAHVAAAAGNTEEHRSSYQSAQNAIGNIKEEEDRKIVLQTFNQVPQP